MKRIPYIVALFIAVALISCEKDEGKGGTSSISGKVMLRQYNTNFTILLEQYYASDEDVFIVYGNDVVYGDKTSTNYDGTFRFDYLREGSYTIFAYSEDSANFPTRHEIPVIRQVNITGKNQDLVVNPIVILK
jgi:hypothetical protein